MRSLISMGALTVAKSGHGWSLPAHRPSFCASPHGRKSNNCWLSQKCRRQSGVTHAVKCRGNGDDDGTGAIIASAPDTMTGDSSRPLHLRRRCFSPSSSPRRAARCEKTGFLKGPTKTPGKEPRRSAFRDPGFGPARRTRFLHAGPQFDLSHTVASTSTRPTA